MMFWSFFQNYTKMFASFQK